MYCLKCKRDTGTSNVERVVTKNNRNMLRGRCDVCGSKKNAIYQCLILRRKKILINVD